MDGEAGWRLGRGMGEMRGKIKDRGGGNKAEGDEVC